MRRTGLFWVLHPNPTHELAVSKLSRWVVGWFNVSHGVIEFVCLQIGRHCCVQSASCCCVRDQLYSHLLEPGCRCLIPGSKMFCHFGLNTLCQLRADGIGTGTIERMLLEIKGRQEQLGKFAPPSPTTTPVGISTVVCARARSIIPTSFHSLARCRKQCFSPSASPPSSLKALPPSCKPCSCFLLREGSSAAPPHRPLQPFAHKPLWPAPYGTSIALATTTRPPSQARPSRPLPQPAISETPRGI